VSNQRLGRGLDELLPDKDETDDATLSSIPITEIARNPHQPRQQFNDDKLDELAQSISKQGVVEPIVVRPYPDGDSRYMIVAGERRWRAAQQAGLEQIPGIVRDLEPAHAYLLSLVENVQRENLSPLEEARAYQRLVEDENYSQDDVAEAVGKSRSAIANRLRLLNLPEDVLDALEDGVISAGHARALLPLKTKQAQTVLNAIIQQNLSVRETEAAVNDVKSSTDHTEDTDTPSTPDDRPKRFDRLEAKLESNLGTNVTIESKDKKSGTIIIHFSSPDEFHSLQERLNDLPDD
jgi:ParB family chromosome partitioning protein